MRGRRCFPRSIRVRLDLRDDVVHPLFRILLAETGSGSNDLGGIFPVRSFEFASDPEASREEPGYLATASLGFAFAVCAAGSPRNSVSMYPSIGPLDWPALVDGSLR